MTADDGEPRRVAAVAEDDADEDVVDVVGTRAALLNVEIVPFSTPPFEDDDDATAATRDGFAIATFGTIGARFGAAVLLIFDAAIAASRRALAS